MNFRFCFILLYVFPQIINSSSTTPPTTPQTPRRIPPLSLPDTTSGLIEPKTTRYLVSTLPPVDRPTPTRRFHVYQRVNPNSAPALDPNWRN